MSAVRRGHGPGSWTGPRPSVFADAWHLPDEFHEPAAANLAEDGHIARVRRTFDGMNWEVDGESPIVYVSVEIGVIRNRLQLEHARRTSRAGVHGVS
jgi:hypothetical protein